MRMTRLWVDLPLRTGDTVTLPMETAHYVLNVLRLRVGSVLNIFNGQGGEYQAVLSEIYKKTVVLVIGEHLPVARESDLSLTLVQAISRPEHMDYTIQKAVELGVSRIIPVVTERSPPLDKDKISKRLQHWQKIIYSACEQCGRNQVPTLETVQPLTLWLAHPLIGLSILLEPTASQALRTLTQPQQVTVLVGAEGGLTEPEITQALQAGYTSIRLGSRILRTETAAIAILAICQAQWGDIGH
jgi:16S rRNA (uracil1498-N3)-methyltransferase